MSQCHPLRTQTITQTTSYEVGAGSMLSCFLTTSSGISKLSSYAYIISSVFRCADRRTHGKYRVSRVKVSCVLNLKGPTSTLSAQEGKPV